MDVGGGGEDDGIFDEDVAAGGAGFESERAEDAEVFVVGDSGTAGAGEVDRAGEPVLARVSGRAEAELSTG
jgi:hypothetical protein